MTLDYKTAKEKLLKACEGYINHHDAQLQQLNIQFPFGGNVGQENPGLKDWLGWQYRTLFAEMSHFEDLCKLPTTVNKVHVELNEAMYDSGKGIDDPEMVLITLNNYINTLNTYIEYPPKTKAYAKIKKALSYDETSYSYPGDAPLSTKLYLTLRHLNALAKFVNGLADYNLTKSTDRITIPFSAYMQNISSTDKKIEWVANTTKGICINLKNMTKEFHHYLKGVAVKELHAELVKPNLSDKQQLESFEALLATGKTKAILYKNRQSINERELKFLSFISILVGIGIFTTLGLAFKRLYDTGGRSVNFFKPLSQELFENASQVLNESLHSHNKSA